MGVRHTFPNLLSGELGNQVYGQNQLSFCVFSININTSVNLADVTIFCPEPLNCPFHIVQFIF